MKIRINLPASLKYKRYRTLKQADLSPETALENLYTINKNKLNRELAIFE